MAKDTNSDKAIENQEWQLSLEWLLENEPPERTREILDLLHRTAAENGVDTKTELITPYQNSIPTEQETEFPGDLEMEQKILAAIRWNAMAMVVNANKKLDGIGGHISTYSSLGNLVEVGFNHFFRGYDSGSPDLVYVQGHASPGFYARSYLEYRFDEKHLNHFRQETKEKGLPSYPHPRALPDYWRFPTVSMGLAPMQAIYQARFLKYMTNRGSIEQTDQNVWAFLGDGEMDEPESTGALAIARREKLDNLIFVINCNLQRLDGPVRGNRKVIDELEGIYQGAGWKVIKVLWGKSWDSIFAKDQEGKLVKTLSSMVDGQLQQFAQASGKKRRQLLLTENKELESLLDAFADQDLEQLTRGGHDFEKIFQAYDQALKADGPVVVLAQTVKGYDQGEAGEASNVTHQLKKFKEDQIKSYRDTLQIPIDDKELEKGEIPYFRFDQDSGEYAYLKERRENLDGTLPDRKQLTTKFKMPDNKAFKSFFEGSKKEVPTTGVYVQILTNLLKDKKLKDKVVPIIPDEARTFGMDSLYRTVGIYAARGQKYEPVDKDSLLYYREEKKGVILEEGISEAGSISSFIAAGTLHNATDQYAIPFYSFYSMFGFQRIGDFIWAAADARVRGFMVGGVSGKTSLSGEGLQHTDGYSHLNALAVPNLKAYDPAFAYELAVIIREGLKRMYADDEDIFYYLTVTNQKYAMPEMSDDVEEGVLEGIYAFYKSRKRKNKKARTNLLGTGAIMEEVLKARDLLEEEYDVPVNVWSVTGYKQIYDYLAGIRESSYLDSLTEELEGPCVAATDYVKALPLATADFFPDGLRVLGTDGFGLSDTTPALRKHFRVDASSIVKAALEEQVDRGNLDKKILKK